VQRIGERLAARSELAGTQFTFTVLNSDISNAFALPGGFVYISRGLLGLMGSEAELASVLGHEIGHVTARHTAERISRGQAANIFTNILGIGVAVLTGSGDAGSLASQATGAGASSSAPAAAPQTLNAAQIKLLAETQVAIGVVHDSADAMSAQARNKTVQAQAELAKKKQLLLAEVLKQKGLSDVEYRQQRYLVSTTPDLRNQFDSVMAKLTGAPLPGRAVAAAITGFVPSSQLPGGMVGTHISHITTSYVDTPDKSGLLVMAYAEAGVASQHAALAMRNPTDLASLQLHAGHIINALDPTIEKTGPGKGFGLKNAANGVANHIELAAKEPNASPNVKVHATHIATAARSTATRADQAIAIAQQIRQAKDAKTAAGLMSQLSSLCQQLSMGADVNSDGRIDWSGGEGGLQQANEHIQLMLAGERK
jgi:hypothetical protein